MTSTASSNRPQDLSSSATTAAAPTPSTASSVISPVPLKLRRPSVNTGTPAINAQPIELDSTPVSPVQARHGSWSAGRAAGARDADERLRDGLGGVDEPDREKRAELLDRRLHDPAVLVDIPQTPGPEDYEVANKVVNGVIAGVPTGSAGPSGTAATATSGAVE